MTGIADTTPVLSTTQAPSQRFGIFALVSAIVGPPIYVLCLLRNWPLFTYHPGPNRFDWLFAPPVREWGPAMYWYGWTANTIIATVIIAWLAAMLPPRIAEQIPRSLGWIMAIVAVPLVIYALRFYWRW